MLTTEFCTLRYINYAHFPNDMPGYAIPSLSIAKEIYQNSESFKQFCSEMQIQGMSENFPKWIWTSTFVKDTSPLEAYQMNLTTGEIRTYTVASSAGGLILVQNYSGLH